MRTGDAGEATRPVVVLSGLGATAARVLPPLTRRGRVAVVAEKGMAITASMLRGGCTGMGILAERVGLDAMVYVRRAERDAVVLIDRDRRLVGSLGSSLLKRMLEAAQSMYTARSENFGRFIGCRTGCRRWRLWWNESKSSRTKTRPGCN